MLERRERAPELGDLVAAEAEAQVNASLELLQVIVREAPGPPHRVVSTREHDGFWLPPPWPRRLPLRPAPHVLRLGLVDRLDGHGHGAASGWWVAAAAGQRRCRDAKVAAAGV